MNKPDTKAECCSDLDDESGCRNNYFDGKRLTTDSFRVEQSYFLGRRHLLNRAVFGWGVVCGFPIRIDGGRLKIGAGLALDECGRELVETGERPIDVNGIVFFDENGARIDREYVFTQSYTDEKVCWRLSVHYAEQSSGSATVTDSCRCEHRHWERTCETVRYSLQRIPCDKCCDDFDCELKCRCGEGYCCDQHEKSRKAKRGGCRCLCDYVTGLSVKPDDCRLTPIADPCGPVCADLDHGVPLACVALASDYAGNWALRSIVDACGPRRLVKRNDLLFDLIRGCDLTGIEEIGWWRFHRHEEPIDFDEFDNAIGFNTDQHGNYLAADFWVRFFRPVRQGTVSRDCFAITVLNGEREGGWWRVLRVPIVGVEVTPDGREARIIIKRGWVRDAVRGDENIFRYGETYFEIEVRGDFILDCNGQPIDANGNGTPGGTFLSTFRVKGASS